MRAGYTLLEIMLATTILVMGLVVIFHTTDLARKKSIAASDLANVQLACQTHLNEILASRAPIRPSPPKSVDGVYNWFFWTELKASPQQNLCVLLITAQKMSSNGTTPIGSPFFILRWIPLSRAELPKSPTGFDQTNEFGDPFW
ncbi:MAG: type IV pilus modification PilV family protein [Thermoguttaceae bacterium]